MFPLVLAAPIRRGDVVQTMNGQTLNIRHPPYHLLGHWVILRPIMMVIENIHDQRPAENKPAFQQELCTTIVERTQQHQGLKF